MIGPTRLRARPWPSDPLTVVNYQNRLQTPISTPDSTAASTLRPQRPRIGPRASSNKEANMNTWTEGALRVLAMLALAFVGSSLAIGAAVAPFALA